MLLAATALAVGTMAVVASPAAAAPTICDPHETWIHTTGSASYVLTHVKGYQLPPGGSVRITKTAEFTKQLSAKVTVSTGAEVSASGVIASAKVTAGVALEAAGSVTSRSSQSVEVSLAASSSDRYYAAYAGRRYWNGKFSKYLCSGDGRSTRVISSGSWQSFQSHLEGTALCPASRYSSGSLPYKACKQTWS
jgi:hypothetical protein